MDEIIGYKMCAVKVRNAKLRNYLKLIYLDTLWPFMPVFQRAVRFTKVEKNTFYLFTTIV
jgi:hypothetical protein